LRIMLETDLKTEIHPTAIVHPEAILEPGVRVGAFCVVEQDVRIGTGTTLEVGAQVKRFTTLGQENRVGSYAILGGEPMDLKFKGEVSHLEVGDRNTIREFSTIHRGTAAAGATRIGNDNFIMAYVHITHDCQVGNHCIIPNAMQMAGHVVVEDFVTFGATVGIHQFCRIGAYSMIGMNSKVTKDILPFSLADGHPAAHFYINKVGLERRGFSAADRDILGRAFRALRAGKGEAALEELAVQSVYVSRLLEFMRTPSARGMSDFARK
jgi:UDP-N-acetylglucosamine acyltransferase